MSQSFPLAPMTRPMTALTAGLLAMPVILLGLAQASPLAVSMGSTAGLLMVLFVAIWLVARPARYDVGEDGITMVFPVWRRTVPWTAVRAARTFAGDAFTREVGWGMRVGAGGLFGSFGWLVTSIGTLEMYVSRRSDLVLVECEGRKHLLVSPSDAQAFATAVRRHL